MKYTLNYIPTATVHYYYGVPKDVDGIVVFRASKSFYKKNFLSTGPAKGNGATVKGKIIKLKAKESKILKENENNFKNITTLDITSKQIRHLMWNIRAMLSEELS